MYLGQLDQIAVNQISNAFSMVAGKSFTVPSYEELLDHPARNIGQGNRGFGHRGPTWVICTRWRGNVVANYEILGMRSNK